MKILLVGALALAATFMGGAVSPSRAAIEDLEQMETRKARRGTNTYYTGATASNSYVRQPESFAYLDHTYGNEVWILSNTPNQTNNYYTDISPANPWSADGARLGYFSSVPVTEFTRNSGSGFGVGLGTPLIVKSDGSSPRVSYDSANRTWGSTGMTYFYWNPVDPNVHYTIGGRDNGLLLDGSAIYKNVVSDASISYSKILDLPGTDSDEYGLKKVISPNGTTLLPKKDGIYYPSIVYPDAQARILDADGWSEQRGQTTEWAGGDPFACQHDMYFPSPDYFILLFSMDCNSVDPVFYKYNVTGSAADGGPLFDKTETAYATFNSKEVEPLWTANEIHVPWKYGGDGNWWGHPGFDRWGRTVTYADASAYTTASDGRNGLQVGGPVTWDYVNRKIVAQPDVPAGTRPQTLVPLTTKVAGYTDHNAWSDYFAFAWCYAGYPDELYEIRSAEYNKLAADNDYRPVARHYANKNKSTHYAITMNTRVAQSPDGTKISYIITYFNDTPNASDIAYAVAYYPHAPEVTSVTNNSGTYTVRFDWRTDQSVSRGYTQRGWPNEVTDDPPPPRETKLFRLWRSPNGTDGWVPVSNVNAEIFSRYNFSTGVWPGSKYWEITDTPGAGTWYYAVTAQEHSGLESRTLSNVFSTTGVQTAAYPSDPKGDSNFSTAFQPNTVRYYNVYAADDGAAPSAIRQHRVASVPPPRNPINDTSLEYSEYTDWLGDTDGSTQYLVTAVDSQGNESGAVLGLGRTVLATPGQYKLTWNNWVDPEDPEPEQPQPGLAGRLSLGGSLIKLAEPEP